jgi:hypothetical protein
LLAFAIKANISRAVNMGNLLMGMMMYLGGYYFKISFLAIFVGRASLWIIMSMVRKAT